MIQASGRIAHAAESAAGAALEAARAAAIAAHAAAGASAAAQDAARLLAPTPPPSWGQVPFVAASAAPNDPGPGTDPHVPAAFPRVLVGGPVLGSEGRTTDTWHEAAPDHGDPGDATEVEVPEAEMVHDIGIISFPTVSWRSPRKALETLYQLILRNVEETIGWYLRRKATHRRWATLLRLSAILFAVLAAVTPVAIAVVPQESVIRRLGPLASVFVALGAGVLALDKFFGFSSGWMRFVSTELDLRARLNAFQLTWLTEWLKQSNQKVGPERSLELLQYLKSFVQEVDQVVNAETRIWMDEFKGNLGEIERLVEQQKAVAASVSSPLGPGAIRLRVESYEQLDGQSYQIQVGDHPSISRQGSPVVLSDLPPGLTVVKVRAHRGGLPVMTEEIVTVRPGEVADLLVRPLRPELPISNIPGMTLPGSGASLGAGYSPTGAYGGYGTGGYGSTYGAGGTAAYGGAYGSAGYGGASGGASGVYGAGGTGGAGGAYGTGGSAYGSGAYGGATGTAGAYGATGTGGAYGAAGTGGAYGGATATGGAYGATGGAYGTGAPGAGSVTGSGGVHPGATGTFGSAGSSGAGGASGAGSAGIFGAGSTPVPGGAAGSSAALDLSTPAASSPVIGTPRTPVRSADPTAADVTDPAGSVRRGG